MEYATRYVIKETQPVLGFAPILVFMKNYSHSRWLKSFRYSTKSPELILVVE